MTHEKQTEILKNKQWIRGCLGFKNLREGLAETVDTIVKNQHEDFVKNLTCTECDKCSLKTLLPNHVKVSNKCPEGRTKCFCIMHSKNGMSCPNSFCGSVYDSIVDDYLFSEPNWSNTNLAKWGHGYFELAKCYIGSSGYKDKHTIQEVDCSALAREHRNELFHSPNMELSDDKLKHIVDNMLSLLHLPGLIDTEGKVKQSIDNIRKIRDGNLFVSAKDEIDVLKETIEELALKKQEALDDINKSKQEVLDKMSCFKAKVNEISELQETTDVDKEQIRADLKKYLTMVDTKCKEIDNRQNEIELSVRNLLTYVKSLQSRFGENDAKQMAMEKHISEIRQTIDNHYIVKLEKENERSMLDTVSAKIEKSCMYSQKKADLQTRLCAYYKRCLSTIPVSPVLQTISGTVDEVFVEFSICTDLNVKDDQDKFEPDSFYREILYKNDTLCKNIYLLGEAGMGKTTWCKKFLNTWVNACNKVCGYNMSSSESNADQSSGNEDKQKVETNDDDLVCLQQFGILFNVALRQVSQQGVIIEMIKRNPVVTEYSLQTVIDDVLKYEPESCIILLDGLDEWEPSEDVDIPSREGLRGCTVVTTSRKYRLVGIDEEDNAFCPDRIVEMTGIRNKEQLIKNVIRQLNTVMRKGNEEGNYEQFIREAKEMKDREISYQQTLPGFLNTPLMLIVMVCLWFDKGNIEDTITKSICGIVEFMIKYAEGFQQGVFRKKKRSAGKLEGIENLNELKREWSKHVHVETLPSQLRQKDILVTYAGLILKVSEFAFDSLFNTKHKIRLVFSQTELLNYFSQDELHVIMKIGLLSQSEVTETFLCRMTKLSFIQKLFHEYLAGVFITIQFLLPTDKNIKTVDMLETYFKDPDGKSLSNIDNAPCFVGGIDPIAGSNMSKRLFDAISLVYNDHAEYFNTLFLRQVQVVHENDENYPSQKYPIYTKFISVPKELGNGKFKYLHMLIKTNISHLLLIEAPSEIAPEVFEILRDEAISQELNLRIYDVTPNTEPASLNKSLQCVPELQSLELRGRSNGFSESEQFVCFDLTSTRLKKLGLKGFSNLKILVRNHTEVLCDDDSKYEIEIQNM